VKLGLGKRKTVRCSEGQQKTLRIQSLVAYTNTLFASLIGYPSYITYQYLKYYYNHWEKGNLAFATVGIWMQAVKYSETLGYQTSMHTVACRPVAGQRPRDKQI
jgi:hypothetical protein